MCVCLLVPNRSTFVIVGIAGQGLILTCFVDQHLSQLLLVTWVCVLEHALSGQVKLAEPHKEERSEVKPGPTRAAR